MGIFGKILLVVNLLAGGGFVYLALQDYKGRQTIAAAGGRHVLLLVGLPLNGPDTPIPARVTDPNADNHGDYLHTEIPFEVEGPGGVKTTTVGPEFLYVYFASAGADTPAAGGAAAAPGLGGTMPVASQTAEVKRVYTILRDSLAKLDGGAARAQAAAAWLLLQPEDWDERAEIMGLRDAGRGDDLAHLLDLKFYRVVPDAVKAGPISPDKWNARDAAVAQLDADRQAAEKAAAAADTAATAATTPEEARVRKYEADDQRVRAAFLTGQIERRKVVPAKDEPERRARLAHLLAHLDQSAAWQKRVVMVVGVRQYVKAIAAQVVRFQDMTRRVERMTVADQERFVAQYALLRQLAIERTRMREGMAEQKLRWEEQQKKDEDFVAQRQTTLTGLTAQLEKVKAEVNTLLAQQTRTEQQLFAVQREVGQTLEEVYRLAAVLEEKQNAVYGQKK